MRRGFHEALKTDPMGASKILAMIQLLYRVEADAKHLDDTARQQLRAERSVPLLVRIEAELKEQQRIALPQSALGKAITYAQNQWPALIRYTEHGMLAIDNNAAERAIRPIAVGRKNWLVAGSEEGGHRAAILYTLVGSCKLLDINPLEYLRDVRLVEVERERRPGDVRSARPSSTAAPAARRVTVRGRALAPGCS